MASVVLYVASAPCYHPACIHHRHEASDGGSFHTSKQLYKQRKLLHSVRRGLGRACIRGSILHRCALRFDRTRGSVRRSVWFIVTFLPLCSLQEPHISCQSPYYILHIGLRRSRGFAIGYLCIASCKYVRSSQWCHVLPMAR